MSPRRLSILISPVSPISTVPEDAGQVCSTQAGLDDKWSLSGEWKATSPEANKQVAEVDPSDVLRCDLSCRALLVEDLGNALHLWSRPAVLIASRNVIDRLPSNMPATILFLDLSWNRFTSLEGFAALRSLRELDISHNGLQSMQGLDSNKELRILKIAHNQIRRVEGLEQLKLLEKIDLSHNMLRTTTDVRALSLNTSLRRLCIEGNPLCITGISSGTLEVHMQHLLPGISFLDNERKPRSLSSSLPLPPPPVPTDKVHQYPRLCSDARGSSLHRVSRGTGNGSSVSRRCKDSVKHQANSWFSGRKQQASRSRSIEGSRAISLQRTTTISGRSSMPRSYLQLHCASKHNVLTASNSAPKPNATHRQHKTIDKCKLRRREPTREEPHGHFSPTPAGGRLGAPVDPERRDALVEKRGSSTHHGEGTTAKSSSSSITYNGQSRTQRAAARRQAWKQARKDGYVRPSGAGARHRKESQAKTGESCFKHACSRTQAVRAAGHATHAQNRRTRTLSAGANSSARHHGGTPSPSAVRLRSSSKRAHVATTPDAFQVSLGGNHPRRNQQIPNHSTTNLAVYRGTSGHLQTCKTPLGRQKCQLQESPWRVARGAEDDGRRALKHSVSTRCAPEARGQSNNICIAGSEHLPRDHSGRQSGGPLLTKCGSRMLEKKPPAVQGRSRGCAHKTSLGRRSRRIVRPTAPHTSRWTPREDAMPIKNTGCSPGTGKRVEGEAEHAGRDTPTTDESKCHLSGDRGAKRRDTAANTSQREGGQTRRSSYHRGNSDGVADGEAERFTGKLKGTHVSSPSTRGIVRREPAVTRDFRQISSRRDFAILGSQNAALLVHDADASCPNRNIWKEQVCDTSAANHRTGERTAEGRIDAPRLWASPRHFDGLPVKRTRATVRSAVHRYKPSNNYMPTYHAESRCDDCGGVTVGDAKTLSPTPCSAPHQQLSSRNLSKDPGEVWGHTRCLDGQASPVRCLGGKSLDERCDEHGISSGTSEGFYRAPANGLPTLRPVSASADEEEHPLLPPCNWESDVRREHAATLHAASSQPQAEIFCEEGEAAEERMAVSQEQQPRPQHMEAAGAERSVNDELSRMHHDPTVDETKSSLPPTAGEYVPQESKKAPQRHTTPSKVEAAPSGVDYAVSKSSETEEGARPGDERAVDPLADITALETEVIDLLTSMLEGA